jgi:DNA-binding NtrC family response regulator
VAVDLASLPETLVASELFGTVRGAFSGAVDRPGRFEEASSGTLFLDEVGNLPPEAQRMLLLVLQDGRVTRLGETRSRTVDVKLVAATNADLDAKVAAGTFRADLHARLNPAARLQLPTLRERRGDLGPLLAVFVRRKFAAGVDRTLLVEYLEAAAIAGGPSADLRVASRAGGETPRRGVCFVLSRASFAALEAHPWPGNVRELELTIATAAVLALSDALEAAREGRGATGEPARTIPIPAKLVRELLAPPPPDRRATRREDQRRLTHLACAPERRSTRWRASSKRRSTRGSTRSRTETSRRWRGVSSRATTPGPRGGCGSGSTSWGSGSAGAREDWIRRFVTMQIVDEWLDREGKAARGRGC